MSKKITIASASSAEYFHFLQGMILSVRDKPQSKNIDISLYDLGLTAEQLTWLKGHVNNIAKPEWEYVRSAMDGMRDPNGMWQIMELAEITGDTGPVFEMIEKADPNNMDQNRLARFYLAKGEKEIVVESGKWVANVAGHYQCFLVREQNFFSCLGSSQSRQ